MADFVYGVSSFERKRGGFPSLPVINMLAEQVPTETTTSLQSRPGLVLSGDELGFGPVTGLYTADGVLGNALFAVSDSKLYENGVLVGDIDGDGPVSFAAYSDTLFVCAGQSIWKYDGVALTTVAFPDDAEVSKILVGGSRLIAIRENTDVIYWTSPLGSAIDPLDFATAENAPDKLKDMLYVGDKLVLLGAETIEYWPITADDDLPFAPLVGATLPVGCKTTGGAVEFNRTFAWVTNFNEVCIQDPDNIISEPQLQIRIQESEFVNLWTFYVDDNEYLAVRLDNETWVYGARTGLWSKFESYGQNNWICRCFSGNYFGSAVDGNLLQWSEDGYEDLGGPLERRFRAWVPLTANVEWLSNVVLRTNPGSTPFITGLYTDPIVSLRTSGDGGNSWNPWRQQTLGTQGKYRKKTFWSSLGQFSYPGALAELRVTDPVPFRVSGLTYNEPFGGV